MHLNLRSLRNKVFEVIKDNNPHILRISECELKKENVDEKF